MIRHSDGTGLVEHLCEVDLRPNDFDWAGHLNNSVHPQLLEAGRWQWAVANGIDLCDGRLVAVVVSLHLDYVAPFGWDPVGSVRVRTALGDRTAFSFTLQQGIETIDGTAIARGRVRLALVDRGSGEIRRVEFATVRDHGRVQR